MARIVVCDDDRTYAGMVLEFLRTEGHKALHVLDVDELRMMLDGDRPDLVVLDMQMGGGGGPAAAKLLMGRCPIVICSGMSVEQQKKWFPGAPKMRYLQKPVNLEALRNAIRELLEAA